jgi:Rrf2 family nitric oxide-sensitive transcriptional repressor
LHPGQCFGGKAVDHCETFLSHGCYGAGTVTHTSYSFGIYKSNIFNITLIVPLGRSMKLTSYTNYALRTLQLAAIKAPALVRANDVARIHGLSRPHVVKIVHALGKAGYLDTVRGRGGGFRLGLDPAQLTVGQVVRLTEGPLDVVECFNPDKNTCPLIDICVLSRKIKQATAAFIAVLDGVTIADIAANRGQLLDRIAPLERAVTLAKPS